MCETLGRLEAVRLRVRSAEERPVGWGWAAHDSAKTVRGRWQQAPKGSCRVSRRHRTKRTESACV